MIEKKLDEIEKRLRRIASSFNDPLTAELPQFQKMHHQAQLLHDSPSSEVVGGSDGIIDFLNTSHRR